MPPPRGLVQRLDQFLHGTPVLPRDARLLVACSGGADSIALLRLLHAANQSEHWGWTLLVGHVNHGLRGKASDADERFVEQLALALGLTCTSVRLALPRDASEDMARRQRFRALAEMAKRQRALGAVLGHHADDQAETVLMRILRGCGLDGLAGMAPRATVGGAAGAGGVGAVTVYRPLLGFRRVELREFLAEIGQQWREDASNDSPRFLRNRLRNEVLPGLAELQPAVADSLVRLAAIAREARDFIAQQASELALRAVVRIHPRKVAVQRGPLRGADPVLVAEVLRYAIDLVGGSTETADHERLGEAARVALNGQGGKRVQLGRGVELLVAGQTVVITRLLKRKPAA